MVDKIAVRAGFFFGGGRAKGTTMENSREEEWWGMIQQASSFFVEGVAGVNGGHLRIPNFLLEMRVLTPSESPLCHNTNKTVLVLQFWFISRSFFSSVPGSSFFQISYALQMYTFYVFLFIFFFIWSNSALLHHVLPNIRNLSLYNFLLIW